MPKKGVWSGGQTKNKTGGKCHWSHERHKKDRRGAKGIVKGSSIMRAKKRVGAPVREKGEKECGGQAITQGT